MSAMWCWPQLLVQPEMLIRTPPTSARPASSSARPMSSARPRLWVTARLQVSAPGAGHHVAGQLGAGLGHADRVQPAVQLGQLLGGEAPEGQVLAVGDPDAGTEVPQDGGQLPELGRRDVAEPGVGDGRHGALGHADHDVGGFPALVGVARARAGASPGCPPGWAPGRQPRRPGASPSSSTTAGMPPGQGWRRAAACARSGSRSRSSSMPILSTTHLSRARSLLSRLPKWSKVRSTASIVASSCSRGVNSSRRLGRMRVGPQAAGDEHPEPRLGAPVRQGPGHGHDADVVEHGLAAVGHAAREVDLELAGEPLGVRMVQEVPEGGLRPGADVEHLEGAGAGQVAPRHVAHRVAAGLPGGQAHLGQVSEQGRDPLELNEVELDVLPGGEVAPAPAVAVGDVGQRLQLLGGDAAVGDLDPDHLVVAALALAVDPVVEPEDPERVLVQPAGEVGLQHPVELGDVGFEVGRDLPVTSAAVMTAILTFPDRFSQLL